MRISLTLVLVAGCLLSTLSATAAPNEAEERFEEGRALVKQGRPAEAIPKFLASLATQRTAAALLNLADAYERIGKVASAHARFLEAAALSRPTEPHRAEEAEKRAAELARRLSTIVVVARADAAKVAIDGAVVPSSSFRTPLPFDPGRHDVVVEHPDGHRETSVIALGPDGDRATVDVERMTSSRESQKSPAPREHPARVPGLVTAGVGVASMIAGGVLGVLAVDRSSDLKSACPSYPTCPAARRDELDGLNQDARTLAQASTITLAAGSAALVVGTILVLVGRGRHSSVGAATQSAASLRW